jgi:hypothetical protein
MLKTCIGTERPNGKGYKDYTHFPETKEPYKNGNGDIFHGRTGAELEESLDDLLPEQIPGIPRHRPGEFSPRYSKPARHVCICTVREGERFNTHSWGGGG